MCAWKEGGENQECGEKEKETLKEKEKEKYDVRLIKKKSERNEERSSARVVVWGGNNL